MMLFVRRGQTEIEPGRQLASLRGGDHRQPPVHCEEAFEPPQRQVPGPGELRLRIPVVPIVAVLPLLLFLLLLEEQQQEPAGVRDRGILCTEELRNLRRQAADGCGDQTEGVRRCRRVPPGSAAGDDRLGSGDGPCHPA